LIQPPTEDLTGCQTRDLTTLTPIFDLSEIAPLPPISKISIPPKIYHVALGTLGDALNKRRNLEQSLIKEET